jgi:3-oxoacyl-[acyl-carrier-protein] synthase-1
MRALKFTAFTATSAIGAGLSSTLAALETQRSGLAPAQWGDLDFDTYLGEVAGLETLQLDARLAPFDCRNNRLAQLGLEQDDFIGRVEVAIKTYGRNRIGVFLGTSTSGILSSEIAYRHLDPDTGTLPKNHDYRHTHNCYSVGDFVRSYFDLNGPAYVISTACSSSAKVFGCAQRLIDSGLIDAAIVGGVDSLCYTTLYGFNSLQLMSANACKPFDANRDGISLGEAAAFVLIERANEVRSGDILLSGIGETSDAHHMSSPHPDGLGAQYAMAAALRSANLTIRDIDYLNLHGTATPSNDAAEDKSVTRLFGRDTPCSSTKGHTGHTLGAAGGLEAVIAALALKFEIIPGGTGTQEIDPQLHCDYQFTNRQQALRHVMSNSFGFGGSNCSLILSRADF